MKNKLTLLLLILATTQLWAGFTPTGFVSQANIFSGEVASNLTTGAPLVVSTTGKVSTGLTTSQATATADTTTTSASDTLMNSMTLTPAAGTYLVWFSTCVDHSNQNVAVSVTLYSGGSAITDTVRAPIPRTNAVGAITMSPCLAAQTVTTVNGSQAIEARWKTSTGTATAHQRTLTIMRTQ